MKKLERKENDGKWNKRNKVIVVILSEEIMSLLIKSTFVVEVM